MEKEPPSLPPSPQGPSVSPRVGGWWQRQPALTKIGVCVLAFLFVSVALGSLAEKSAHSGGGAESNASEPGSVLAPSRAEAPNIPRISISARDLLEAYETNEAAADTRFKSKWVTVSNGVVLRIAGREDGGALIIMTPGPGGRTLSTALVCMLSSRDRAAAEAMVPGDKATLSGRCGGLVMAEGARTVFMNDCALVKSMEGR
ncbi:MAG: hypothetical protein KAI24_13110 [Planctomycetes bacterium]|nr:hypothetical protein [Planctomycetota bacterium]